MGYGVYEDSDARDYGVERWAGHMVPAECDMPDCREEIERDLDSKCEQHPADADLIAEGETDPEMIARGCGMFFCSTHLGATAGYEGIKPKPDSLVWMRHQLTDESWADWRAQNPATARSRAEAVAAAVLVDLLPQTPRMFPGGEAADFLERARALVGGLVHPLDAEEADGMNKIEADGPSDDDMVPCRRCGQWRLPPSWYRPQYRWLGHSTPCIGAKREPIDQPDGSE